jgi:hypothetical protein
MSRKVREESEISWVNLREGWKLPTKLMKV